MFKTMIFAKIPSATIQKVSSCSFISMLWLDEPVIERYQKKQFGDQPKS